MLSMEEAYGQIDFDAYDDFDEYENKFGGEFEFPDDFEIPDGVFEEQFIESMEKVRKSMEAA